MLFGVGERYSCAVSVTVEPIRESATAVLENPEMDVITPLQGTENAKLRSAPAASVIINFQQKGVLRKA
jgi:hypothetical protein